MRSDAQIRSEVENRLKRRGLLVLDAGFWIVGVVGSLIYVETRGFQDFLLSRLLFLMLMWTIIVVLHTAAVLYIEMRERLVNSAIERERQFYLLRDNYEKQKRSEAHDYEDDSRLRIADEGELVDYPAYPQK